MPERKVQLTGNQMVDDFRHIMRWINVILVLVIILSYVIPGLFHLFQIKILRFVKGVFYLIFLSPTYVIIFGIYSAANIHDVTWGSRPTTVGGADSKISDADKTKQNKRKLNYENYRANQFLCWILLNLIVGWGISFIFRNNEKFGVSNE